MPGVETGRSVIIRPGTTSPHQRCGGHGGPVDRLQSGRRVGEGAASVLAPVAASRYRIACGSDLMQCGGLWAPKGPSVLPFYWDRCSTLRPLRIGPFDLLRAGTAAGVRRACRRQASRLPRTASSIFYFLFTTNQKKQKNKTHAAPHSTAFHRRHCALNGLAHARVVDAS